MTLGRFSLYVTAGWMDTMWARAQADDIWLALVSADPLAVSDPMTVEVVGEALAREQSDWEHTTPTMMTLLNSVLFTGLPPGAHVAGVAGFDAPFNGHLLFSDLLDSPVDFPSGGSYTLPAGEYVIGIDTPGA
jgi:hypothetical protein